MNMNYLSKMTVTTLTRMTRLLSPRPWLWTTSQRRKAQQRVKKSRVYCRRCKAHQTSSWRKMVGTSIKTKTISQDLAHQKRCINPDRTSERAAWIRTLDRALMWSLRVCPQVGSLMFFLRLSSNYCHRKCNCNYC